MCGIAGALCYESSGQSVTEPLLEAMARQIVHRGPDGGSHWICRRQKVGLTHRRLAIIDLSPEAYQPMENEDGTVLLAFNGEIYNHAEIRKELEALGGHQWRTDHSDTEVMIHAYETWGIDFVHRLRGMFAFALWDEKEGQLWLVRDRIGIKPLYWTKSDGRLLFASEIKAILADPSVCRAVRDEALPHYMSCMTTPAPMTFFKGIEKLPPGMWMRVDREGRVETKTYWDPFDVPKRLEYASEDEIAHRLLEELRTAVRYRKVADVPVGVFLSGGIDSSTNAALFSEGEGKPVKTFSIGYDDNYGSYPNELEYAKAVADRVGAEYHELRLSVDDLLDFLPQMIHLQDEPNADPVCVPLYYVSKLARDNGVVVCQVGEGADELFCGYNGWKAALTVDRWNRYPFPRWGKRIGLSLLDLAGKQRTAYREKLRRGVIGKPVFWGGAEAFSEFEKNELLSTRIKALSGPDSFWPILEPIWNRFQEKAWEASTLHWMTYLDLKLRLPELLLMRVDKMSMGVSLEARVPFLDHKFVELALSIPTEVKLRNNELKYILKKAVRGLIPDDVIDRKKQGFGVPVHEWFFQKLGARAKEDLTKFCRETDYFNPSAIQGLFDRQCAKQVWYVWNFALWHRSYIEGA